MKSIDDIIALLELRPKTSSETWIAWISRMRGDGLIDEQEWLDGVSIMKKHNTIFISKFNHL